MRTAPCPFQVRRMTTPEEKHSQASLNSAVGVHRYKVSPSPISSMQSRLLPLNLADVHLRLLALATFDFRQTVPNLSLPHACCQLI